jgi:hypothetical protein
MPDNILPMVSATNHDNSKGIRGENGRWLRGPGRPVGAKNKQSSELMKAVRAMGPRAVEKLAAALDGNEQWAVLLILKYCLPPSRTIEMEGAEPEDIKQAFISGDLSADETKSIATAMEKLKNVQDLDDLRARLSELENLLQQKATR